MPLPDKTVKGEDSGLANAVKNRSAHVVHLTHNDLDAVGADAIHRMKYGSGDVFTIWRLGRKICHAVFPGRIL